MSDPQPRFDLAGIGSMVVDTIHRAPRLIGADQKILLERDAAGHWARRFVGGVVLNQLGWARILGLRVAVFGKLADDANGALLRAGMRQLGIAERLDASGSASAFAQIYVDPAGGRGIYMARGATGEVTPEEVEHLHRTTIESARVVSTEVSQLPLRAVRRVLEIARAAGARTVLDLDVPLPDAVPALGSEQELQAVLALADLIKPSLAATAGLVAAREPERVAEEMARSYGARAVAVTVGAAGAVLFADGKVHRVPAPRIRAVDTTGAGDAFLGGLLAGLQLGLDWPEAARLGNACGAACCERVGAFPDDPLACRTRALELWESSGGGALELPPLDVMAGGAVLEAPSVSAFASRALQELETVAERLDPAALLDALELVRCSEGEGGRAHVTGVGKPEHVARYAASLLSSTGTPATFLHATEATHGSVGQIRRGDVLIALSNSGETEEIVACVSAARALGARVIAISGSRTSRLARASDVFLDARVAAEGDALGLAPRASALAEMLVVAALSVALQEAKGFRREDFHARHPAGALGRRSS